MRLPVAVLGVAALLALGADCVASDRPLVLSLDGELYLLPNVFAYDDLAGVRGVALRERMDDDDWALWAPIRHAPDDVRGERGTIAVLASPSAEHWLGTDDRGRDVAARLVHGARQSLALAALAALLAGLAGLGLALVAVRAGPIPTAGALAACDAIAAVPPLLAVVAVQGLVGHAGLVLAAVLIAAPRAADLARLTIAGLRATLVEPWCEAARAAGATPGRVIRRHALPHAAPVIGVAIATTAATAVLAEAALAFVGFGAPPPTASWGELLAQATAHDLRWWLAVPAGLAVTVLAAALFAVAERSRGKA